MYLCGTAFIDGTGCLLCYLGKKRQIHIPGHRGPSAPKKPTLPTRSVIMKRMQPRPKDKPANQPPLDQETFKDFPLLSDHLADTLWDDGGLREPSKLTLTISEGRVLLCLSDQEANAGMFANGETLWEALTALEDGLAGQNGCRWVKWKKWKK